MRNLLQHIGHIAVLPVALLAMSACERPFVEPEGPEIEVIFPDLSEVLTQREVTLLVEASSVRPIDTVRVNGRSMTFNNFEQAWELAVALDEGLNTLVLAAHDDRGMMTTDTAHAVLMPFVVGFQGAPDLPAPRAGHTATQLRNGAILVTGGVTARGGDAMRSTVILPAGASSFQDGEADLNEPRTGHSASLLPDGRVIFLGGSRMDDFTSGAALVIAAEIFDPERGTITPLIFRGDPIQRALHTAAVRTSSDGAVVIDLYGGRGAFAGGTGPVIRNDLRSFALRGDSLIALQRSPGPTFPSALAGHTQTRIDGSDPGEAGRFLIAGSHFAGGGVDNVAFIADFTRSTRIVFDEAPTMHTPRTRHAAVLLADGVVLITGGNQRQAGTALEEGDLYIAQFNTFFNLPAGGAFLQRSAQTATNWTPARILMLGGFSVSGNAVQTSEFFETEAF